MRILKDEHLSVLTKVFSHRGDHILTGTVMLGFKLDPPGGILSEDRIWSMAADNLGRDEALDLGMPKPEGEVLVAGWCFTDGGRPAAALEVGFAVGKLEKKILVYGDRCWSSPFSMSCSTPQPFTKMKLSWERAFGGPNFGLNPVGTGIGPRQRLSGELVYPLPNLEDPRRPISSPTDRPSPAGFGPLGFAWPDRLKGLGTFDQKWVWDRWPGLPDDFNFRYYNLAPGDQRLKGFFKGDETVAAWRLHPDRPNLVSTLPGLKSRLFIVLKKDPERQWLEARTDLDTIWLFPHLAAGVLIWRGLFKVEDEEAEDVNDVMAVIEPLAGSGLSAAEHEARLLLPQPEVQETPPPEASPRTAEPSADKLEEQPGEGVGLSPAPSGETIKVIESSIIPDQTGLKNYLAKFGINPDDPGPPMQIAPELTRHALASITPPLGLGSEELLVFYQNQIVQEQERLKTYLTNLGFQSELQEATIEKSPIPTIEEFKDQLGQLPDVDQELIEEIQKLGRQKEKIAQELAALLDQNRLETQASAEVKPQAAEDLKIMFGLTSSVLSTQDIGNRLAEGRGLAGMDLTGHDLSTFKLMGIDLSGAILENAKLAGLDLTGTIFSKSILTGADLSGCKLSGAKFDYAGAARAKMAGAECRGADLSRADLTGADLRGADLSEAVLTEADFSGANLAGVKAEKAKASGALFIGADLTQADFSLAELSSADLSQADLKGAKFVEADLQSVWLSDVNATGADFRQANLIKAKAEGRAVFSQAGFFGADLTRAYFEDADFSSADLSRANLFSASLVRCRLNQAKLPLSKARQADLSKSDLTGADLRAADLMESSLRKARLTGADLSLANLFAADVYRCTLGQTKTTGANLKRTLLSRQAK